VINLFSVYQLDFPKEYCIWIWKQQDQEADQEADGWMKWGRMEKWSVERSDRKKCMTGRNGRGSWERQGITAFCTCQWIDWLISVMWKLWSHCLLRKQKYVHCRFVVGTVLEYLVFIAVQDYFFDNSFLNTVAMFICTEFLILDIFQDFFFPQLFKV